MRTILLSIFILFSKAALASGSDFQIPPYYHQLAQKYGVPSSVVFSLALTETNTKMNDGSALPWPFVINRKGKATYFLTYEEMIAHANSLLAMGIENFDVGLFQVNWYWVGRHEVDSVETLGEPTSNGDVALKTILKYKTPTNSWSDAAGKYHNPNNNNGLGDVYAAKFEVHLRRIQNLIFGGDA
ncbi:MULTISPECIES: hypothetical protein [Vibrio]|uniref:hypothetical protein n=1 Tax=Vibrio TaxID=662 RepID=UPI0008415899|nr:MULTISPECIES: hypothetical protein [Vibrio]ODM56859.1 hypothetical protein BC455_18540 [Vibrio harveyi]USD58500.1 hypothetical protein J4N44_27795 [Vibrio sp. SCSIO 43155]